jgi:AAA domain
VPIRVINVREHFAQQVGQTMKLLVAGPPGAGKTRMASTFPNVVYADAEGRLLSVRDRNVRAVPISSVKELEDMRGALDQRPDIRSKTFGGPVDTVVIDTVDHVARILIEDRKRTEKREVFTMQDWGVHGDRLRDLLRGFRDLTDLNVVMNVHVKSDKDEETGRVEYMPRIQGAVGGEVAEYVDECFLLVRRTGTDPLTGERIPLRFLQTYADSQYPWLKDHSGTLPLEFPVDFNTDYERLAKAIFGAVPAAATSPTRAEESVAWTPSEPTAEEQAEREIDQEKVKQYAEQMRESGEQLAGEIRDSAIELRDAAAGPAKKKAAPRKKAAARAVVDTSDVTVEQDAPHGDVVADEPTAPVEEPTPPTDAAPPDTSVPENGTESGEPPAEEAEPGPACDVCGTTDINENYLELSEARWGVYLCRDHFLERNKQK